MFDPDANMLRVNRGMVYFLEVAEYCNRANAENRCDTLFGRRYQS